MKLFGRLAAIFLLLGLAACTTGVPVGGPRPVSPRLDDTALRTADGNLLPVKYWAPVDSPPRAVLIMLHGFNEYRAAFDLPAPFFARHGIVVYAYDQRGFGETAGRGRWAGTGALSADLATMVRLVAARHPDLPLFILGESMGGAVAMVTLAQAPVYAASDLPVRGLILSAPAVWTRDSMNVFQRAALWLAVRTVPGLTLTGRGLHIQASDNDDVLRRLGADPLVIKATRVDAIDGLCDLMDAAAAAAPHLAVPTLVLYGDKDQVIPAEPFDHMVASLTNHPEVRRYDQGYHLLMRDLDSALVLNDIVTWIDGKLP